MRLEVLCGRERKFSKEAYETQLNKELRVRERRESEKKLTLLSDTPLPLLPRRSRAAAAAAAPEAPSANISAIIAHK